MKKILLLLALFSSIIDAQGIIGSPNVSLSPEGNFLITIQIRDVPEIQETDIQIMDFKSSEPLPEKTLEYFLFENLEIFQRLTFALPANFQDTYFSFRLQVGLELSKDIFIFLPQNTLRRSSEQNLSFKLPAKKTSGQSQRYNIQDALSGTVEEQLIKQVESKQSVDDIAESTDLSKPQFQLSKQTISSEQVETIWSVAKSVETNFNASIYQIMWAFYLENPNAFINENINLVRSDIDLAIPSPELVQSTNNLDAKNAVNFMSSYTGKRLLNSRAQLILTAPKNIQPEFKQVIEDSSINSELKIPASLSSSNNARLSGEDIVNKNTSTITLGVESKKISVPSSTNSETDAAFQLRDLLWVGVLSLLAGFLIAITLIGLNRKSSYTKTSVQEDFLEDEAATFQSNLSISNDIEAQELDLVRTYIDMDDWANAEPILQRLILNSSNAQILISAKELLEKKI